MKIRKNFTCARDSRCKHWIANLLQMQMVGVFNVTKHLPKSHCQVNNSWITFATWPIRIVFFFLRNRWSKVLFSVIVFFYSFHKTFLLLFYIIAYRCFIHIFLVLFIFNVLNLKWSSNKLNFDQFGSWLVKFEFK